jgi:hypothetical protein
MTFYDTRPIQSPDKYSQGFSSGSTTTLTYPITPNGVWAAYTDYPTLFEMDPPVVLFGSELEALRYAIKDTSRVVKVAFVPFGVSLATKLL